MKFFIFFLISFPSRTSEYINPFYKLINDCIFRDRLARAFSHELRCVWTHSDIFQKDFTAAHIHFLCLTLQPQFSHVAMKRSDHTISSLHLTPKFIYVSIHRYSDKRHINTNPYVSTTERHNIFDFNLSVPDHGWTESGG